MRRLSKNIRISISLIFFLFLPFKSDGESIKREVKILMPAPFAEATKELVKDYNIKNSGRIKLKIIRGPRETGSMSDLAISNMLLGDDTFD